MKTILKRAGIVAIVLIVSAALILSEQPILSGLGSILMAALLAWVGVLQRKGAQDGYEGDVRRYTARTMMTVVQVEESIDETRENQADGSTELCRTKVFLPTYEYTVNGKTYQYSSRQSVYGRGAIGQQVVGYYDPAHPHCITENKPRKPVCSGFIFFIFAVFLLCFGVMIIAGDVPVF